MAKGLVFGGLAGTQPIKSIQRINSEWTPNVNTITKSISEVDLSKSIILLNLIYAGTPTGYGEVLAKFINSTTIELSYGGSPQSSTSPIIDLTIIEFNNVKSIQRASVAVTHNTFGTYDTFSITPVDPNKSLIVGSHKNTYTSVNTSETHHIYKFNSGSQIAISRGMTGLGATTAHYQVIEFN